MTVAPAFQMPVLPGQVPPLPQTPGPKPPAPRIDVAAKTYRELRAKKEAITAELKERIAPIQQEMNQLEAVLLDVLDQSGQNSANTDFGTVYKTVRNTYSVADPHAFRQWVESHGRPDFYENRVSKEALDSYIEGGGELPPGVKLSSFVTVNIRK